MSERYLNLYLNDILESIDSIFSYISDTDYDEFCKNRMIYSAVIREFEIIGEATKKIPKEIRQNYKNILWRDIIDFRNLLIHEYFGVDHKILWNTIHNDLHPLKQAIQTLLAQSK
jgi:uncharacterized protein with HEPN domain